MSPPQSLWLQYRPHRLAFRGGDEIIFPLSARMLYQEDEHMIGLELPAKVEAHYVAALRAGRFKRELKTIEYEMLVNLPGIRRELPFRHRMEEGAGLSLKASLNGHLYFDNKDGAPIFSKDYTLHDVSYGSKGGQIDSDRPVWQFHGYRHEH